MANMRMRTDYPMISERSWDAIVGGVSSLLGYDVSRKLGWVLEALLVDPEEASDYFEECLLPLGKRVVTRRALGLESLSASEARIKSIVLDTVGTWYLTAISRGLEDMASTQVYELSRRLGVWMDVAMIHFAFDRAGAAAPSPRGMLTNAEVLAISRRWALGQTVPWKSMSRLMDISGIFVSNRPLATAIQYLAVNVTVSDAVFGQLVDSYEIGSIIGMLMEQESIGISSTARMENMDSVRMKYAAVGADAIRRYSF